MNKPLFLPVCKQIMYFKKAGDNTVRKMMFLFLMGFNKRISECYSTMCIEKKSEVIVYYMPYFYPYKSVFTMKWATHVTMYIITLEVAEFPGTQAFNELLPTR